MTKTLPLLALALVSIAGAAAAEDPRPLDPYGRPYIGSRDYHPGPGDYGYGRGPQPRMDQEAMAPRSRRSHETAFKDEYGFRYDERGNRLRGDGRVISPRAVEQ